MTPEIPDPRVRTPPELARVNTDDPAECVKKMLKAARDMELETVVNILTSHDEEFFRNNINDTDSSGRVSRRSLNYVLFSWQNDIVIMRVRIRPVTRFFFLFFWYVSLWKSQKIGIYSRLRRVVYFNII